MIKSEDLEARRSDGYRTLTNPQLRGEGNWPKVTLYALMEARIFFSTDAMLTNIPFWFKVTPVPCEQLPGSCWWALSAGDGSKFLCVVAAAWLLM